MEFTPLYPMLYIVLVTTASFAIILATMYLLKRRSLERAMYIKELLLFVQRSEKTLVVSEIFHQTGIGLSKISFASPAIMLVCTFPNNEDFGEGDEPHMLCTIDGTIMDANNKLLHHRIWKRAILSSLSFTLCMDASQHTNTQTQRGLAYSFDEQLDSAHVRKSEGSVGNSLVAEMRLDYIFEQIFFAVGERFEILRVSGVGGSCHE